MILLAAEKLTLEQIKMMDLPPLVVWAIPVMLALVVIEFYISVRHNRNLYTGKDLAANVAIGLGNILVNAAAKFTLFAIILFFYNLVPWRMAPEWWTYIPCLIAIDLFRYISHRIAHERRFFWATHVTHHSSKHLNYSTSFRLGWTQHLKIIFFIPMALIGFHPLVFFICHQIGVLYQFWTHTELINKVHPVIEYIFVTPSHHRVHHGKNVKYIDKNYGSMFILFDRWFGTFQVEEEKVVFGIKKDVNSFNPVYLVFHEFVDIFRDLKGAKSGKDVWTIIWGRPGQYVPPGERAALENNKSNIFLQTSQNGISEKLLEREPVTSDQ